MNIGPSLYDRLGNKAAVCRIDSGAGAEMAIRFSEHDGRLVAGRRIVVPLLSKSNIRAES